MKNDGMLPCNSETIRQNGLNLFEDLPQTDRVGTT